MMDGNGNLTRFSWQCKFIQPLWIAFWLFLAKFKMCISYDSASAHLNNYSSTGVGKLSVKGHIVNSLAIVGHIVSLQKLCSIEKAVIDNTLTNEWLCSNASLFINTKT